MSIELSVVITVISVLTAIKFGWENLKRNNNSDVEHKAVETATINVKLDNILTDVRDIKYDISTVKKEQQMLCERMVAVEQSTKSAHNRIDGMEKK